jgi:hypothetical protein
MAANANGTSCRVASIFGLQLDAKQWLEKFLVTVTLVRLYIREGLLFRENAAAGVGL